MTNKTRVLTTAGVIPFRNESGPGTSPGPSEAEALIVKIYTNVCEISSVRI